MTPSELSKLKSLAEAAKKQAWVKAGEFATYPNFVTSHDVAEFMFKEGFDAGYAVGRDEGKNDAIIEYKDISAANQYKFISLENTASCAEDMRDKDESALKCFELQRQKDIHILDEAIEVIEQYAKSETTMASIARQFLSTLEPKDGG